MKKKQWQASYTVEATFIIPIVTLVMILLITETLFYRDILTAERIAATVAENGVRYTGGDAKLGEADWDYSHFSEAGIAREILRYNSSKDRRKLEEYATEKLRKNLWFAVPGTVSAQTDGSDVTIRITIRVGDDIIALFRGLNRGMFVREVSVTERGHDAPFVNRTLVAAWETAGKTKGVSEFIHKLEELLEKLAG